MAFLEVRLFSSDQLFEKLSKKLSFGWKKPDLKKIRFFFWIFKSAENAARLRAFQVNFDIEL